MQKDRLKFGVSDTATVIVALAHQDYSTPAQNTNSKAMSTNNEIILVIIF